MSSIIGSPLSGGNASGGNAPAPYQPPPPSGGGVKIAILFGAVVALLGASVYLFYQVNQLRSEIGDTRDSLMAEITKQQETSSVTVQTSKRSVEALKKDLDAARRQASVLAGDAKVEADKHADELATKLEAAQQQQAQRVTAVANDVTQVKDQASQTQSKVGEVSTEVGSLKTQQTSTQQQLEKTVADLRSTIGDLGVQSGLIATNGKELATLKSLGERNYTDVKLAKVKTPTKFGDVQLRLIAADPKKNKYTIELTADDKKVEKKDKGLNEPVQFYLDKATQPYELVINQIQKDMIVGYVSAPKVQKARN
jgi:chromosome segregation ATPase